MAFLCRFKNACDGADAWLNHADIETCVFDGRSDLVDERFGNGAHQDGEVGFCAFDDFVINVEEADWNRDILVNFDFNSVFKGIFCGNRDGECA
ncbi:hypothetical protein D9M69_624430 [compost metagenome]